MSKVIKKIQDYLAINHNDLFNDDLTEKQDINKKLFDVFNSEVVSDDKKGYIRKQKAKYIQQLKNSNNNVITCNNDIKNEVGKTTNNTSYDNYDNIITLLQNTLQSHNLQISELSNRITELESLKEIHHLKTNNNDNDLQSQISKNDLLDTEKARYTFYITNNNIDYLKTFCKENNNISITSVINFMINSFKNNYPVTNETPKQ